jgi:hypothetical protein
VILKFLTFPRINSRNHESLFFFLFKIVHTVSYLSTWIERCLNLIEVFCSLFPSFNYAFSLPLSLEEKHDDMILIYPLQFPQVTKGISFVLFLCVEFGEDWCSQIQLYFWFISISSIPLHYAVKLILRPNSFWVPVNNRNNRSELKTELLLAG